MAAVDVSQLYDGASVYDEYINELRAQQAMAEASLQEAQAMQDAAIKKQVEMLVSQIDANRPIYEQNLRDNSRAAYIQNQISKRDLPQQLSAMGLTGGLSESALLGLDAAYGEQLAGYQRDYDNQIADLDRQVAAARMQGELSAMESAMDYQQMLADARQRSAASLAEAKLNAAFDAREQAQLRAQLEAQRTAQPVQTQTEAPVVYEEYSGDDTFGSLPALPASKKNKLGAVTTSANTSKLDKRNVQMRL